MSIDTKRLRELAEEVRDDGGGEWHADGFAVSHNDYEKVTLCLCTVDAAYIAAADPATVLALLDERDALLSKVARAKAEAKRWINVGQRTLDAYPCDVSAELILDALETDES